MKTSKLLTTVTLLALFYSHLADAGEIIRTATAEIVVNKVTQTKVNGRYQYKEEEVCRQSMEVPVVDHRLPGNISDEWLKSLTCSSTVKGEEVKILTTPMITINETSKNPFDAGNNLIVKTMGGISAVYFVKSAINDIKIQDTLTSFSFSKNLQLQDLGVALMPHIQLQSKCAAPVQPPSSNSRPSSEICEPDETINLEEYFVSYLYIEDKSQ